MNTTIVLVATVTWKWFPIVIYSIPGQHLFSAYTHYFDYAQMRALMSKAYEHNYTPRITVANLNGSEINVMECCEILLTHGDDRARASILLSDIESLVNDMYNEKNII